MQQVQVICLEFLPQNDHCNHEAVYNITYNKQQVPTLQINTELGVSAQGSSCISQSQSRPT